MKKQLFLKNAAVLTVCSLLMSVGGMAMRVFQSAMIGTEGMGLLQLLLSVYYFTTNLAISGLNLAVTRLVSESMAKNDLPVPLILRRCLLLCLGTGSCAGLLLFGGAPWFGSVLLNDARTVASLRVLAFSLPFFSVSCCCRGYFLAVRNSLKPCLGQLLEQLSGFAVSAALLPHAAAQGLSAACGAIAIGMTVGELCGHLLIVAFTLRDLRKYRSTALRLQSALPLQRILSISVPIALGYYLRSALIAVENVLIPAGLKQCGSSYAASLAAYGTVKGIALPTVQFPASFLSAFSLLLIPEVTQSHAVGHMQDIRALAQRVFRICLRFSVLVVACFLVFADTLGQALYGNRDVGRMLRILCPLVPFMYLDSIVDAMLKGLNEQVYSLKVNMSESCIRIVSMIVLLPRFGLRGYLLALYISILYNASLSIGRIMIKSKLRIDVRGWLICPALCAVLACLCGQVVQHLMRAAANTPHGIALPIVCTVLLYFLLISGQRRHARKNTIPHPV